jgi:hypothetical protein
MRHSIPQASWRAYVPLGLGRRNGAAAWNTGSEGPWLDPFFRARPLRIEFPGAVYDVTSRGKARQNIYRYATVSRIIKAMEEMSQNKM